MAERKSQLSLFAPRPFTHLLLQGYVVHEAADGQSGVDIFTSHPIFELVC